MTRHRFWIILALVFNFGISHASSLEANFRNPPDEARPGVYWYFMDGNLTREGMTADLEAMQQAGIGNLIFLEVNVGVPRGPVEFMSPPWQALFKHAVEEAKRLGIAITLNAGPGWTGSGGPWIDPARSMQHLVASEVKITGPARFDGQLPTPQPRPPYFGNGGLSSQMLQARQDYYQDVAVLAIPTVNDTRLSDIDEKALYKRDPYTSAPRVKAYLPEPPPETASDPAATIDPTQIIDLTGKMQPDGHLTWQAPPGQWTILRFGRRDTGANTRPAPQPGLGFECDKFDTDALNYHFDHFIGQLLKAINQPPSTNQSGWTMLHIDSWEMGAQNWSGKFRQEFQSRRGYDPLPWLPILTGRIIQSPAISERFLWDLRFTAQELVIENHAQHLKTLAHQNGFGLSIEPYDMNPTSDLVLGSVADVPMCEFWSKGYGFNAAFSCFEAASIAHTLGRPVVAAEAFTANPGEYWRQHPGSMKNQGDWAFCAGINRFVFHTFAHKPSLTDQPGMTMGPYGVHWDRTQTWWPMAGAYHSYLSRCQYLLRQGHTVADICYLIPEGAPHVFRPPASALDGLDAIPDRKGYNFDGCTPDTLMNSIVREGKLVVPGGVEYAVLVLPNCQTMRPALLRQIARLVKAGATVIGPPPDRSPSLSDYPQCDNQVRDLARSLWGESPSSASYTEGKQNIIYFDTLYPDNVLTQSYELLKSARWIWYPKGNPIQSIEPDTWYFCRPVNIDPSRPVRSARAYITADNTFELWINGQSAGSGDNFNDIKTINIQSMLKPGNNILAVAATNEGDSPNPAGLIAAIQVDYAEGEPLTIVTDANWLSTKSVAPQWQTRPDNNSWQAALDLGPFAMAPWNLTPPGPQLPPLYPDYDITARILADKNIVPDFQAGAPVRYTHRRTAERDLYFIANKTDKSITASCQFRVAGRQPELWNPLTGAIRTLHQFKTNGAITTIPIHFEPYQSFFIVFSKNTANSPPPSNKADFPNIATLQSISGPWQVAYNPQYGGPDQPVTFTTLQDWTQHPDPDIRYYSGRATYSKEFELTNPAPGNTQLALDLGVVHNLARVTLNGHDLGVLWCHPWRVDITSALKPGRNHLEIEVANLWPNRLIRDKALPEEQRITRTTYNTYSPDSPLLPSGLIGPVTIKTLDYSLK